MTTNVIVRQKNREEMYIKYFVAKECIAATQRNKQHCLYFSRMAQQRGFRQTNCCRALANQDMDAL